MGTYQKDVNKHLRREVGPIVKYKMGGPEVLEQFVFHPLSF